MLHVVGIRMGDHLGNHVLLAFPDHTQGEVNVRLAEVADCRRMKGKTAVTKETNLNCAVVNALDFGSVVLNTGDEYKWVAEFPYKTYR
ncbi:hypothetical protein M8J77_011373 [Diaphorina citri]|nr:hypothetical protein M8J77_011373 [Diaphorina citri]